MTGQAICELLRPLIGKSGTISLIVRRVGYVGFAEGDHRKLISVEVREDGLVRIERETGWTVLDPAEIVAVAWVDEEESSPGLFL